MLGRFLDVAVIPEIAREKISGCPKLPHEMSPEERASFQTSILREQIEKERSAGRFLSDRSVFDAAAYAFDTPEFERLSSEAALHARSHPYTKVFFLPSELALSGDGIRSEDEDYRLSVEKALVSVLNRSGIAYETVTGGVGARLGKCLKSLGIPPE